MKVARISGPGPFDHGHRLAAQHGCSRVEWTTDDGNAGAQAFYQTLGLPRRPSKVFYRVEDTGGGFVIGG